MDQIPNPSYPKENRTNKPAKTNPQEEEKKSPNLLTVKYQISSGTNKTQMKKMTNKATINTKKMIGG